MVIKTNYENKIYIQLGYQRTVAPPFGGFDSTRASSQTAPSGSVHVQET